MLNQDTLECAQLEQQVCCLAVMVLGDIQLQDQRKSDLFTPLWCNNCLHHFVV